MTRCKICRRELTCKRCSKVLIYYGECLECGKYHCIRCINDIWEDTGEMCPCRLPSNYKYIHNKQRFSRIQRYLTSKKFLKFYEKIVSLKIFLKIGERNE